MLSLSERDGDELQKRMASNYHFEEDANKFLNTALLLMLRRARTLEVFKSVNDLPYFNYSAVN